MSVASISSGVRPPPVSGINIHSHLSCGMMHWPSPATDPGPAERARRNWVR